MLKSSVEKADLSPGMQKAMDTRSAENANLMVQRESMYQSQRLKIGMFLQSLGLLYSHYGGLLMRETDPRAVYHVLEHITALIRDDRMIAYSGIVSEDVEDIKRASITLMNENDQEQAEAERKKDDGR